MYYTELHVLYFYTDSFIPASPVYTSNVLCRDFDVYNATKQ